MAWATHSEQWIFSFDSKKKQSYSALNAEFCIRDKNSGKEQSSLRVVPCGGTFDLEENTYSYISENDGIAIFNVSPNTTQDCVSPVLSIRLPSLCKQISTYADKNNVTLHILCASSSLYSVQLSHFSKRLQTHSAAATSLSHVLENTTQQQMSSSSTSSIVLSTNLGLWYLHLSALVPTPSPIHDFSAKEIYPLSKVLLTESIPLSRRLSTIFQDTPTGSPALSIATHKVFSSEETLVFALHKDFILRVWSVQNSSKKLLASFSLENESEEGSPLQDIHISTFSSSKIHLHEFSNGDIRAALIGSTSLLLFSFATNSEENLALMHMCSLPSHIHHVSTRTYLSSSGVWCVSSLGDSIFHLPLLSSQSSSSSLSIPSDWIHLALPAFSQRKQWLESEKKISIPALWQLFVQTNNPDIHSFEETSDCLLSFLVDFFLERFSHPTRFNGSTILAYLSQKHFIRNNSGAQGDSTENFTYSLFKTLQNQAARAIEAQRTIFSSDTKYSSSLFEASARHSLSRKSASRLDPAPGDLPAILLEKYHLRCSVIVESLLRIGEEITAHENTLRSLPLSVTLPSSWNTALQAEVPMIIWQYGVSIIKPFNEKWESFSAMWGVNGVSSLGDGCDIASTLSYTTTEIRENSSLEDREEKKEQILYSLAESQGPSLSPLLYSSRLLPSQAGIKGDVAVLLSHYRLSHLFLSQKDANHTNLDITEENSTELVRAISAYIPGIRAFSKPLKKPSFQEEAYAQDITKKFASITQSLFSESSHFSLAECLEIFYQELHSIVVETFLEGIEEGDLNTVMGEKKKEGMQFVTALSRVKGNSLIHGVEGIFHSSLNVMRLLVFLLNNSSSPSLKVLVKQLEMNDGAKKIFHFLESQIPILWSISRTLASWTGYNGFSKVSGHLWAAKNGSKQLLPTVFRVQWMLSGTEEEGRGTHRGVDDKISEKKEGNLSKMTSLYSWTCARAFVTAFALHACENPSKAAIEQVQIIKGLMSVCAIDERILSPYNEWRHLWEGMSINAEFAIVVENSLPPALASLLHPLLVMDDPQIEASMRALTVWLWYLLRACGGSLNAAAHYYENRAPFWNNIKTSLPTVSFSSLASPSSFSSLSSLSPTATTTLARSRYFGENFVSNLSSMILSSTVVIEELLATGSPASSNLSLLSSLLRREVSFLSLSLHHFDEVLHSLAKIPDLALQKELIIALWETSVQSGQGHILLAPTLHNTPIEKQLLSYITHMLFYGDPRSTLNSTAYSWLFGRLKASQDWAGAAVVAAVSAMQIFSATQFVAQRERRRDQYLQGDDSLLGDILASLDLPEKGFSTRLVFEDYASLLSMGKSFCTLSVHDTLLSDSDTHQMLQDLLSLQISRAQDLSSSLQHLPNHSLSLPAQFYGVPLCVRNNKNEFLLDEENISPRLHPYRKAPFHKEKKEKREEPSSLSLIDSSLSSPSLAFRVVSHRMSAMLERLALVSLRLSELSPFQRRHPLSSCVLLSPALKCLLLSSEFLLLDMSLSLAECTGADSWSICIRPFALRVLSLECANSLQSLPKTSSLSPSDLPPGVSLLPNGELLTVEHFMSNDTANSSPSLSFIFQSDTPIFEALWSLLSSIATERKHPILFQHTSLSSLSRTGSICPTSWHKVLPLLLDEILSVWKDFSPLPTSIINNPIVKENSDVVALLIKVLTRHGRFEDAVGLLERTLGKKQDLLTLQASSMGRKENFSGNLKIPAEVLAFLIESMRAFAENDPTQREEDAILVLIERLKNVMQNHSAWSQLVEKMFAFSK